MLKEKKSPQKKSVGKKNVEKVEKVEKNDNVICNKCGTICIEKYVILKKK